MVFGTADELASLNGLLSLAARERAKADDCDLRRHLFGAQMPDLRAVNERITRRIPHRRKAPQMAGDFESRPSKPKIMQNQ
jgi:hypothetical protein